MVARGFQASGVTGIDWGTHCRAAGVYMGPQDTGALDQVLARIRPNVEQKVLANDIKRQTGQGDQDILDDVLFSQLCVTAWANGSLLGVAQTVLSDGFQNQVLWGRASSEPGGLRQIL